MKEENTYKPPNSEDFSKTIENGKDLWFSNPISDCYAFKIFISKHQPFIILANNSITLKKLRSQIRKKVIDFPSKMKIYFQHESQVEVQEVKDDQILSSLMFTCYGETIPLTVEPDNTKRNTTFDFLDFFLVSLFTNYPKIENSRNMSMDVNLKEIMNDKKSFPFVERHLSQVQDNSIRNEYLLWKAIITMDTNEVYRFVMVTY